MPELPEVETIRRDLAGEILRRHIVSLDILSPKAASPAAAFFKRALLGRRILKIERRGKLLIFALSGGNNNAFRQRINSQSRAGYAYLLIHLKMTGQLIYIDKKVRLAGGHSLTSGRYGAGEKLPNKYTRAIFSFTGGGKLFFNDLRKFGYLKLVTDSELARILEANYGPEPLSPDFSWKFLAGLLESRNTKIKALLLDQKKIAGLGNIYVDESLFAARIRPDRRAGSLSAVEIKRLWREINRIIGLAIKQRGTTFSDYVDSRGRHGNFSRLLKVYGRSGEKCSGCGGTILRVKIAGRGSHYCPHCQK